MSRVLLKSFALSFGLSVVLNAFGGCSAGTCTPQDVSTLLAEIDLARTDLAKLDPRDLASARPIEDRLIGLQDLLDRCLPSDRA